MTARSNHCGRVCCDMIGGGRSTTAPLRQPALRLQSALSRTCFSAQVRRGRWEVFAARHGDANSRIGAFENTDDLSA